METLRTISFAYILFFVAAVFYGLWIGSETEELRIGTALLLLLVVAAFIIYR